MHYDTIKDIISVKQLLNNSINEIHFDYIRNLLNKTVEDCNLLFTQVCYLIKLFLSYDYENNKGVYNDYIFNELFIRNCFKLIKTSKINDDIDETNNNLLINRLYKFYNHYNLDNNNKFKFIKPTNFTSITHITDSLSRDIQTNITNNITLNYNKYLKEYIFINLNLDFKNKNNNDDDIDIKVINKIYNDMLCNTCSIT
jgi:hypothetical protein